MAHFPCFLAALWRKKPKPSLQPQLLSQTLLLPVSLTLMLEMCPFIQNTISIINLEGKLNWRNPMYEKNEKTD